MFNKVILIGRLCAEPEPRITSGGSCVCRFRVAADRAYRSANGERATDFVRCSAWGKTGEFVESYFAKGAVIGLEGHLLTGSYDKDGERHYSTEVLAERCFFVGAKQSNAAGRETSAVDMDASPEYAREEELI